MAGYMPSTLSDHPSLVGIIKYPNCTYDTYDVSIPIVRHKGEAYDVVTQTVKMATNVSCPAIESQAITIPKSSVTDFYPYTYYVLTDGESEPLIMQAQYLKDTLTIKGRFALSHQVTERYYPSYYKGSITGTVYNITNNNTTMLPTATNNGLAYLQANSSMLANEKQNWGMSMILSGVSGASNIATGKTPQERGTSIIGTGQNLINGYMQIKSYDARNKDQLLTPSTISSFGNPSTRNQFFTNNVRVLKYSISGKYKNKINNFVARYGNKYNNFATIDIRNYKGYIKFIAPDIDATMDYQYVLKLIEIFERGVYIE